MQRQTAGVHGSCRDHHMRKLQTPQSLSKQGREVPDLHRQWRSISSAHIQHLSRQVLTSRGKYISQQLATASAQSDVPNLATPGRGLTSGGKHVGQQLAKLLLLLGARLHQGCQELGGHPVPQHALAEQPHRADVDPRAEGLRAGCKALRTGSMLTGFESLLPVRSGLPNADL